MKTKLFCYVAIIMIILGCVSGRKSIKDSLTSTTSKRRHRSTSELKTEFITSLKRLVQSLPNELFCKILGKVLKRRKLNHRYLSFVKIFRHRHPPENMCKNIKRKHERYTLSASSSDDEDSVNVLLSRLYNRLPLPFQCNILTMATLRQYSKKANRREHADGIDDEGAINFVKDIILSDEQNDSKLKLKRKISRLLVKTENRLQQRQDIVPIANQCGKLILQRSAYSNAIKFIVKRTKNVQLEEIEEKLEHLVPRIIEKYAQERGINTSIPLYFRRKLGTSFRLAFFERRTTQKKHVLYATVHLMRHGQGPENTNFILAALYDYGRQRLSRKLKSHLKFAVVLNKTKLALKTKYIDQEMTFPVYLSPYFNQQLPNAQKCFIIKLISAYSNSSDVKVLQTLLNDGRVKNFTCSLNSDEIFMRKELQPLNATVLKMFSGVNTTNSGNNTEVIQEFTTVEIMLIFSLSCVFVSLAVFLACCGLFFHRRTVYNSYSNRPVRNINEYYGDSSDLHEYYENRTKHDQSIVRTDFSPNQVDKLSQEFFSRDSSCDRYTTTTVLDDDVSMSIDCKDTIPETPRKSPHDTLSKNSTDATPWRNSTNSIPEKQTCEQCTTPRDDSREINKTSSDTIFIELDVNIDMMRETDL